MKRNIDPASLPKMPSFTIVVTQEVIDNAEPNHSGRCMVSMSGRLNIPGSYSWNTNDHTTAFNLNGIRYTYILPAEIRPKVGAFDKPRERKLLKPFKFKLRYGGGMVAVQVRLDAKPRGKTVKRRSPGLVVCKRRYHGKQIVRPPHAAAA